MICSHGENVAFCWGDATPAEREIFEFLHRHAYNWATGHGPANSDAIERYAAYFAGANWRFPEEMSSHSVAFRTWVDPGPATQAE